MDLSDDFCPIADTGELQKAAGVLGRFRRRQELPPVDPGFERVLIDTHGNPSGGGAMFTAGEKYWANGTGWVKVDVGEHTLRYEIRFEDAPSRAGLAAVVTVKVVVRESTEVVRLRIRSVKAALEPALREAIAEAPRKAAMGRESGPSTSTRSGDPVGILNEVRQRVENQLRSTLRGGVALGVPAWLDATVSSVSVDFDANTQRHYEELVKRSRAGELIDADAYNKRKETGHAIDQRDRWRRALKPYLSDPAARAFEVVFSDPSAENIAGVVAQLNAADRERRGEVLGVLNALIDKYYIDKDDDMFKVTIEAIVSGLQGRPFMESATQSVPAPQAPSLGAGTSHHDRPIEPGSDRDWEQ